MTGSFVHFSRVGANATSENAIEERRVRLYSPHRGSARRMCNTFLPVMNRAIQNTASNPAQGIFPREAEHASYVMNFR
jgi:hypothetical protein